MKLKSFMKLTCVILPLALLVMAGCSKKTGSVVAKVGDRVISADDINGFFERAGARFASADQELKAKREFLDSLINQNLLIIGAYEHNLQNQEEVGRVVEGEQNKFLLDVLFEEKILSKATPSEAEIKDWYAKGEDQIKVSHILVGTEEKAQEMLAKLKSGGNFEELAIQNSLDPAVRRNQGDLGWLDWGYMPDNFQDAAFKMKAGEISAPVKTEYGYHIIKVSDRRKVDKRPSYAEAKGAIRSMIIEKRKQSLMRDYFTELHSKYPIKIERPTCDFVLKKLEFLYPDSFGGHARPKNDIDQAQLDKDEQNLVLGSYKGGQLTLGQYLTNLKRVPPERRPNFDIYDSLNEIVFQMAFMDILALEAKDAGIDKSKVYLDKLAKFKELAMADVMRNDSIPAGAQLGEPELQAYYDSHPDEFTQPLRYHLLEIQAADEAKALNYKKTIRSEDQFKKIAAAETERPGGRQVGGDLGILLPTQFPELYDAAKGLNVGQMAGPIQSSGKFSIIWVKERIEPAKEPFENARARIVDKLTKERGDSLYQQWIADIKKRVNVEVFEDVLSSSIDKSVYTTPDSTKAGG